MIQSDYLSPPILFPPWIFAPRATLDSARRISAWHELKALDMDAREQWWKRRRELGWKDCGRVKRGGISNMLGQMHDPTVVCHSCRFRSFQYILVPSKRFLLSPFPSSYNRLPLLVALFIQPPLPSICFLFLIVHFSRLPPSRSPLDRPFFSSFSRNYSFHCCMYGYI